MINDDIKKIFDASCRFTADHFGEREYVFVNERNPERPMPYSVVQYHLTSLIQRNDLRDDSGELFRVDTHAWRRCYGMRLVELGFDDLIIAKLLGHANTASLRSYRKVKDQILADQTRPVREEMDTRIRKALED